MHNKCSGMRKCLTKIVDFVCKKCFDFTDITEVDQKLTLNGDVIGNIAKLYILGMFLALEEECKKLL